MSENDQTGTTAKQPDSTSILILHLNELFDVYKDQMQAIRDIIAVTTPHASALDEPAVKMVVTWGLSDRHSWIVRRETHESKWRGDDLPSRPLPFDADLQPKSACEAIAHAFSHAPVRAGG